MAAGPPPSYGRDVNEEDLERDRAEEEEEERREGKFIDNQQVSEGR
jgi:hypothetical protein